MSSGTLIIYISLFRSFDGVSKKLSENGPKRISNDEVRDTTKKTRSGTRRHSRVMSDLSVSCPGKKTATQLKGHGLEPLRHGRVI